MSALPQVYDDMKAGKIAGRIVLDVSSLPNTLPG